MRSTIHLVTTRDALEVPRLDPGGVQHSDGGKGDRLGRARLPRLLKEIKRLSKPAATTEVSGQEEGLLGLVGHGSVFAIQRLRGSALAQLLQ